MFKLKQGTYLNWSVFFPQGLGMRLMIQRDTGVQILENTVLGGRRCTSYRDRKNIYNCNLSKVAALRGTSGAYKSINRFGFEETINSPVIYK